MYATSIIIFREILEAALIIGIVLAATRGVAFRGLWVTAGIGVGLLGAAITAVFAGTIASAAAGVGQEIFNASILFLAVGMLGWHVVWMQRHGREIAMHMKKVGGAVLAGERPIYVLAIVVSLAVLREGAEIVLFLHGIAATDNGTSGSMLLGGMIGIGAGVLAGLLIYLGLLRIPSRYLFAVTTWMILLLAAGMAAQGAKLLEQANLLPALGYAIWNSSSLLSEQSVFGQLLHILVGYTDRPSGIQILAYLVTLVVIITTMKWIRTGKNPLSTRAVAIAVTLLVSLPALSLVFSNEAHATQKVYSPHVEQGELELEVKSHIDRDNDPAVNNTRKDKYEIGYGFTDWWFSSVFVEYEREPGERLHHSATAWENIFQLTDTGKYWLDAGFYVEYEVPEADNTPEKLELKLLLEKSVNRWVHTFNFEANREVGGGASNDVNFGYAWRTKYKLKPEFEPGIELYGDLGNDHDFGFTGGQSQQIGPVFSGKLGLTSKTKFLYEAGYLFGLNDSSPSNSFKWLVELETRF